MDFGKTINVTTYNPPKKKAPKPANPAACPTSPYEQKTTKPEKPAPNPHPPPHHPSPSPPPISPIFRGAVKRARHRSAPPPAPPSPVASSRSSRSSAAGPWSRVPWAMGRRKTGGFLGLPVFGAFFAGSERWKTAICWFWGAQKKNRRVWETTRRGDQKSRKGLWEAHQRLLPLGNLALNCTTTAGTVDGLDDWILAVMNK